jgi:hypothetical protein
MVLKSLTFYLGIDQEKEDVNFLGEAVLKIMP